MSELNVIGKRARKAAAALNNASADCKNTALKTIAERLLTGWETVIRENERDVAAARDRGTPQSMLDRLTLTRGRIEAIAQGLDEVRALPDPVGRVLAEWNTSHGLIVTRRTTPLGVIAIIYEARPNVTVDAAALCLKASNAVILRGGSEAICTNLSLVRIMRDALEESGLPGDCVQLIEDTSRESAVALMRLKQYVDVLIPRGGAGLIKAVVENSSIPVIETGTGNCHIYVAGDADVKMALDILINAKVQRPSVCNAAESLLVDRAVKQAFLPAAFDALRANGVEIRGCAEARELDPSIKPASDEDYGAEYNELIISVKVVSGMDEAIEHINTQGTRHSEAIITTDDEKAGRFLREIDAAAVYVNASTRFTDGYEFGFGSEIGISTQKLHARGPMGLPELTSYKYEIRGDGQVRK